MKRTFAAILTLACAAAGAAPAVKPTRILPRRLPAAADSGDATGASVSVAAQVRGEAGQLRAGADLVWVHSAAELEALARAALPLRLGIGGAQAGQALVIEEISGLRLESGRARVHLRGRVDPLGAPLEADPVLTLRFDPLKGAHVVKLESMSLALGPLGRVDLSRLLGPWEIRPEQTFVAPVRGGAGLGMQVTLRTLSLSPAGLRAEADVRYFPPPAATAHAR